MPRSLPYETLPLDFFLRGLDTPVFTHTKRGGLFWFQVRLVSVRASLSVEHTHTQRSFIHEIQLD